MRRLLNGSLAAAAVCAALIFSGASPAAAQVARAQPALATGSSDALLTQVRWRGRHWRHRHWRHRHWRHHHHGGFGPGIALGLATGAIIGGAIAAAPPPGPTAYEYCVRRFRSYDPASGTYLGYDGLRHPCP